MKQKMKKLFTAILMLVFLCSSAAFIKQVYDGYRSEAASQAAREIAASSVMDETLVVLPEEPVPLEALPEESAAEESAWEELEEDAAFLLELELEELRRTSGNVLGWIYIPDTPVDYPLMAFEDNEAGLHRSWDGTPNSEGCIFLECKNRRDLTDFNTLIYGHHMRKGTMFGSLKYYAQQDYLEDHELVYIVTDDHVRRYQVFSAYEAGITTDTYRLYFKDDEMKQTALDHYISSTSVETECEPTVEDRILTLSTCMGDGTYETRWVVQAVLTGEFPR